MTNQFNITFKNLKRFSQKFNKKRTNKVFKNVNTKLNFNKIITKSDYIQNKKRVFKNIIDVKTGPTDQKGSGRCWLFAFLNVMRIFMIKKYNLEDFEFSQNYLFFYDKLEKANYFLNFIYDNKNKKMDDLKFIHMLDNLTNDGGQWNVFVNLINKYGIIPKSAMDDHYHSANSYDLNEFFNDFLRKSAHKIRTSNVNKIKVINELLEECYKILVLFLGEPPQVINWDYYALKDDSKKTGKKKTKKNKELKENKENKENKEAKEAKELKENKDDSKKIYKVVENISPLTFYKKFVPYDANNKICLINYPCKDHKYYKLYNVELAFNLIGNKQQNFINVPIEVMIEATKKSINNGEAVWTGIDYGKYTASKEGFLDVDGFNYDDIFEFNNLMDKCDSLNYRQSFPNHAVILRGYNFGKGNTNGFLVENSHGDGDGNGDNKKNEFNENLYMSLKWFKQFVYMVVIDKSCVSYKELKVLKQKPNVMPYWSPFGSLLNGGSKN